MGLIEVEAGTWRIESRLGTRHLFQYVIASGDEAMIVDTGVASTPHDEVLPALARLGIRVDGVRLVLVTHPDTDHQGGLAALRAALPAARLACGLADRAIVTDPARLVTDRYGAWESGHGIAYSDEDKAWMLAAAGPATDVDATFSGGEAVRVGDRQLAMLHAPGHSPGHLIVHEPATEMIFSSDAVQGAMYPDVDGGPALGPTYEDVDAYLATIDLVESLRPRALHSGHWPEQDGAAIGAFLLQSRRFVADVDRVLLDRLDRSATLAELCAHVDACAGPFAADPIDLVYAVHGHVRRLVRLGVARTAGAGDGPPGYVRVDSG